MAEAIIISLGGSIINPGTPNVQFLKGFAALLSKLKKQGYKIGVVCGGGVPARIYVKGSLDLGGTNFSADKAGIFLTKANSMLVISSLKGEAFPEPPLSLEDAATKMQLDKILVSGAYETAGISTDADSVLLAEACGAKRLINISKVGPVYDSDPVKNKNAKKFDKLTHEQLEKLAFQSDQRSPGTHFVFDLLSTKLAARSKIELHFVGTDLKEIEKAIKGEKHDGTLVK